MYSFVPFTKCFPYTVANCEQWKNKRQKYTIPALQITV